MWPTEIMASSPRKASLQPLQMASDQALGLAAQVDAVDALGQVADTVHGSAVLFCARLLTNGYQGS